MLTGHTNATNGNTACTFFGGGGFFECTDVWGLNPEWSVFSTWGGVTLNGGECRPCPIWHSPNSLGKSRKTWGRDLRDELCLRMGTELVPETLYSNELTRLCAREDYIESCGRESFKIYASKLLCPEYEVNTWRCGPILPRNVLFCLQLHLLLY
jgi:hypothetical protein